MTPRTPIIIVGVCLLLRAAFALGTEIYPDEAYYWTWAQRPQLAYFDHPGLIAWSIALLGIRTGAIFWGLLTLAGVHRLASSLGASREQAWWATALFASTPASALLGTLSTPDAPLLAFWVWTLVALQGKRPAVTGLLWGLAMLSKYNGVLLAVPVLMVFFRRPLQLALATLLALAVTSPTIAWNATHDWEGFRFQLWHGLTGGGGGLLTFLEFLGAQLLMGGPVLVALAAWWLARERSSAVLKLATLLPLAFFGLAAWSTRGEANWAAAAWLSASVGLALAAPFSRWKQAAVALNLALLFVCTALIVFPPAALWELSPVKKLHGWAWLERARHEKLPVITNRYQLSGLVAFHARVPVSTLGGRRSQFDLWGPTALAPGADALWIGEWEGPPPALVEQFETSTQLDWPLDQRQRVLHPFLVFKLGKKK
ncbi:MAG: glycosyltransferase family 39 protein [Archangium sp.]|nr:glycosyltransferase family 39 protein [Archangium sp.]